MSKPGCRVNCWLSSRSSTTDGHRPLVMVSMAAPVLLEITGHFCVSGHRLSRGTRQRLPVDDNRRLSYFVQIIAMHRRTMRETASGRSSRKAINEGESMSTEQGQLLITSKQAASMLAISERTLWQLTNDGHLPAVRFGRTVRYDLGDLRAFIASRRCGGNLAAN
jgi:excisionase family DNA binding protein